MVVPLGDGPAATPLTFAVDRGDPERLVVSVGGGLDFQTAAPLRSRLDGLIAGGPAEIVLDLAELRFIDSTGLAVIVHAWRSGHERDTVLRLRAVPRFLTTILDITGVAELLERAPRHAADGQAASSA